MKLCRYTDVEPSFSAGICRWGHRIYQEMKCFMYVVVYSSNWKVMIATCLLATGSRYDRIINLDF